MGKTIFILVIFCAAAVTTHAGDYTIKSRVNEKNGNVEIAGRISGGDNCKSLKVKAWAETSNGDIVSCTDVTKYSGTSTLFSCQDKPIYKSKFKGRDWAITLIRATCVD